MTASAHDNQATKSAAPATKPQNAKARLTSLDSTYEFDERVIGSHTQKFIFTPFNLDEQSATARFSVAGSDFSLLSTNLLTLPSKSEMTGSMENLAKNSPLVEFSPTTPGTRAGSLEVRVDWSDGHTESLSAKLRGAGRALDQVPEHQMSEAEQREKKAREAELSTARKQETELARLDGKKEHVVDPQFDGEVDSVVRQAERALDALNEEQKAGVTLVESEALAYRKLPPKVEPSVLWTVAEIALSMATAGLAAHLAKVMLPRLVSAAQNIGATAAATVGKETAKVAFSDFTTDLLKEGFKKGGAIAIKKAAPKSSGASDKGEREGFGNSTHPAIDFFEQQRRVLNEHREQNRGMIIERADAIRPLLRTSKEDARAAMLAIADGIRDATMDAAQLQAAVVAPLWMSIVARMSLGTETAMTADGDEHVTTSMTKALAGNRDPVAFDGLLDIYVERSALNRPTSARLHGSSFSLADRLASIRLADAPMPVRVVIGASDAIPTIVTRDDAGRVRVAGDLALIAGYNGSVANSEADAVEGGQKLVLDLLAQPLLSRGIKIKTDDATGRDGVAR